MTDSTTIDNLIKNLSKAFNKVGTDIFNIKSNLFIKNTLSDLTNNNNYYYGGLDVNNNWCITRYNKTTLLKVKANKISNTTYNTLELAWVDRTILVYE